MPPAVLRGALCALLLATLAGAGDPATAKSIRIHLFNLDPGELYSLRLNGADNGLLLASAAGSGAAAMSAATGDMVSVDADGAPDLQPPSPPLFTSLETADPGCARAQWIQSGDPNVVGYVVSFGRSPGVYDDTVEVGAVSSVDVCELATGTHYFSVQCRNYLGMLSAHSAERSVEIIVVSVLISSFDARVVADGVALSWTVETDERLLGFRVYRTGPDRAERLLNADLIPVGENGFVDRDARAGTTYSYHVAAVNEEGEETRSFAVQVETPALTLSLGQNIPNPFNPATTIPFVLETRSRVTLRVYDVRGAEVTTLFDGTLGEGKHGIAWDGRNRAGRPVPSGTYLYSLVAGKQRFSRKMVVVR